MEFNFKALHEWFGDNGDNTHRLNYNLNSESIVVDVGGYFGNWTNSIYNLYNCNLFILEPIKKYYDDISYRFINNDKIKVINYGLAAKNDEVSINIDNDGSSMIKSGNGSITEIIEVKTIDHFLNENNISHVDLIKINIEGIEYDLLDDIILKNLQNKFDNIQIQFHTFVDNCEMRRNNIRNTLSKTHECTYNYDFIWENWKMKK